jgi:hypothetical protein
VWTRCFFVCLALASVAMPATAYERPFPAHAKRGKMTPDLHPVIVIDGKPRMLSPGARIWNENNLIEQPASLRGTNHAVNYTENADGDIDRVWILTPEETTQSMKAQQGK